MTLRVLIAFAAALALAGCGVKSDLEKPTASPQKAEKDPSKPPSQLGR
jgi:predicted small lipoprotein YifL